MNARENKFPLRALVHIDQYSRKIITPDMYQGKSRFTIQIKYLIKSIIQCLLALRSLLCG